MSTFGTMLKRLTLILIVAAGLFALQPEVTTPVRVVAATEFVISAKKQEAPIAIIAPPPPRPQTSDFNLQTLEGFHLFQSLLIEYQQHHSSLLVA
jgi:hypothetical protein